VRGFEKSQKHICEKHKNRFRGIGTLTMLHLLNRHSGWTINLRLSLGMLQHKI
jgi:hypothetical protein